MPKPHPPRPSGLDRYAQRFLELKQELQNVQYFCKGTVLERKMKCGQPGCACHTEPAKRHGPYWEWTYKVNGKTVHESLTPETGPLYKTASRQHRKLKLILARLERFSRAALQSVARKAQSPHNRSPG
jgi:hypothetical protein